MATVAIVIDGAAELLGILPVGGVISATNSTRINRSYDRVFADLKKSGLDSWPSAGTIPDDIAPHVEALMAFEAMDTYYVNDTRAQRIILKESKALREIRRLSVPDYESLDKVTDF